MEKFDNVIDTLFGPETPDTIRKHFRKVFCEGVKYGLYLERERLDVPDEIWEKNASEENPPNDELEAWVENVAQHFEEIIVELDQFDSSPLLGLRGSDLKKARQHLSVVLTKLERLALDSNKMLQELRLIKTP